MKNIQNLGKVLSKSELLMITGLVMDYEDDFLCHDKKVKPRPIIC